VVAGLNKLPGVSCAAPKGAFYTFPNVKKTGWKAKALASSLLEDSGVAIIRRTGFGILGEGYVRLSYANSTENILKSPDRMASSSPAARRRDRMRGLSSLSFRPPFVLLRFRRKTFLPYRCDDGRNCRRCFFRTSSAAPSCSSTPSRSPCRNGSLPTARATPKRHYVLDQGQGAQLKRPKSKWTQCQTS